MKVIGTGNPIALTLRLREREVHGLRDELLHRESVAEDALANGDNLGRVDRRTPIEVREAAVAMRNQLDAAKPNEQGRVVVTGPTWLLGPSIITATIEAGEQVAAALRRFVDAAVGDAEALRDAISTSGSVERDADRLRPRREPRARQLSRYRRTGAVPRRGVGRRFTRGGGETRRITESAQLR